MKKLALATASLAAVLGHAHALSAQPAPTPTPAPSTRPTVSASPRTLLDPEEAFGATYGTSNLARQPNAITPPHVPSAQRTVQLRPQDMLDAQNARRRPPASVNAFAAYLRNDQLLAQLLQAQGTDAMVLAVLAWNHVALDMTSIDHTTAGVTNVFEPTYAEQFGPPRSARAMAIAHLAMFEAANAVDPQYRSYTPPGSAATIQSTMLSSLPTGSAAPTPKTASIAAAISRAAYDTLVSLYPNKKALLDVSRLLIGITVSAHEASEAGAATPRLALGEQLGAAAAKAILEARQNDGSAFNAGKQSCAPVGSVPAPLCWEDYFDKTGTPPANPADWTADEILPNRLKLGANWSKVKPFVLADHEFVTDAGLDLPGGKRPLPTAADLESNLALRAYGDMIADPHGGPGQVNNHYGVRAFGGFGAAPGTPLSFPPGQGKRALTTSMRTPEQTQWAEFWGYDATALLCAPPRLYNMVATSFLLQHMDSPMAPHQAVKVARYLALTNIALADSGLAAWDAKYRYHVARPVTFIRNFANGNEDDAIWTPLGQVASNGAVTNVTPPFPSYPSGHAVFGGALFTTIAKAMGVDKNSGSSFDFVSDEFNGNTIGADGQVRSAINAHYVSLGAAEWENAESRIWLGIHWQPDADDGSALGDAIGDAIFNRILQPLTP